MGSRAREYITKTSGNMSYMKTLEKNGEASIYEYFDGIKRNVYLRRDDLIQRIHNYGFDECFSKVLEEYE